MIYQGGAHGVGASVVGILYGVGAHVTFGDIDEQGCKAVVDSLQRKNPDSTGSLQYLRVDVRKYEDNLALFQAAFEKHGRVDHALCIAGITEGQNWFENSLDLESIRTPPSTRVLDVNLLGAMYFVRIAAVYLRQNNTASSHSDKSIVLLGSLASFKEQAGLFVYQPAKHGVLGLLRSTRQFLHTEHNIRVNIVCPSLIDTGMSSRILHVWKERSLPINSADQVADYVTTLAALQKNPDKTDVTGLAVYVEGGNGWELEQDLDALDKQWMGEEMSNNAGIIHSALGTGSGWTKELGP
ncbi:hypothetical protein B7463_g1543, partial [Scytalidium lignicola]